MLPPFRPHSDKASHWHPLEKTFNKSPTSQKTKSPCLRQWDEMSVNPDLEPEQEGKCSQANTARCLSNVTSCGNRSRRPLHRIAEYGAVPSGYAPTILWPAFSFSAIPAWVTMQPLAWRARSKASTSSLREQERLRPLLLEYSLNPPLLSPEWQRGRSPIDEHPHGCRVPCHFVFGNNYKMPVCVCVYVFVFACVYPLSEAAGKADSLENEGRSTPH